ncbi:MAG: TonB-dependent receptor [Verrucomicrobiota bacterium]|nr:TonB-dependent receptor [Verrucomicrobiota bacterium]
MIALPRNIFRFLWFVFALGQVPVWSEDNASELLNPFEQAELIHLLNLDFRSLSQVQVRGVLGYDQQYWRNPASVHVIEPEDVTQFGYANTVEALRGVPGMHVSRGLAYDNFASMRNFSGFSTQKFLGKIGGREVSQLMLGSANYSVDDYPIAVIDRIEVIRGPGASIWGTNAVNGVINLVTKHSGDTQGDSVRLLVEKSGTFMGDYVHGGQISEDSFYRVWVRNQEYAEGTLDSGLPARDDGYLRKFGFRYDKELGSDLNLFISAGAATRRLEHVLDLSSRLRYNVEELPPILSGTGFPLQSAVLQATIDNLKNQFGIPLSESLPISLSLAEELVTTFSLPTAILPPEITYNQTTWNAYQSVGSALPYLLPTYSTARYERYAKMSNDSGHLIAKLEGITDADLEWSLTGFVDHSDIYMGHLGYEWQQTQYDLSFDGNLPLGVSHLISFGASARRTDLDVSSEVIDPFRFGVQAPILDYDQDYTQFNRFNAYLQDSITLSNELRLSLGAKVEENDLSGFGLQPGVRGSWMANDNNVVWIGYSKAHRQPSLRERYTSLTPYKDWSPATSTWVNKTYAGDEKLDREEMDAYEVGWRIRPNKDLLFEFSTYFYDTKNAVRLGTSSAYEAKDAEAFGGELSVDWSVSDRWRIRAGYSNARGKVEGTRVNDFPEDTASLSSEFSYSDDLTFVQSLFYAGSTEIPSDYNPITIPSHLRLDLGLVWEPREGWEIGFFGRDLLEPYHLETMYPAVDVEPTRVERNFILSVYKKF